MNYTKEKCKNSTTTNISTLYTIFSLTTVECCPLDRVFLQKLTTNRNDWKYKSFLVNPRTLKSQNFKLRTVLNIICRYRTVHLESFQSRTVLNSGYLGSGSHQGLIQFFQNFFKIKIFFNKFSFGNFMKFFNFEEFCPILMTAIVTGAVSMKVRAMLRQFWSFYGVYFFLWFLENFPDNLL